MNTVDGDILLTRASLATDAIALGRALLDADPDEARFRTHLVMRQAIEAGLDDVAHATRGIAWLLKDRATTAVPGIGRALLSLSDAIEAAGGSSDL